MLDDVSLVAALRDVATVLGFRVLPFLGFILVTRQVRLRAKLLVALSALLGAFAIDVSKALPLGPIASVYVYFAVGSTLVPLLVAPLRSRQMTRGGLFAGCAGAFLVVPGLLFPETARLAALLIGWDLTLSSYSYVVEVARTSTRASRSDCSFFLLVNPTLVYVDRGECFGPPALERRGALRAALGLGTMFAASALLVPLCSHLKQHGLSLGTVPATGLGLVAYAGFRFLLEYARHSGLASLQIGLMRQLGHALPERYVWPLAAQNPMDFWQRWNTYVGGWMARYVFRPAMTELKRRRRRASVTVSYAAAVLLAFVATGVLHDAAPYLGETGRVGVGIAAFFLIGVLGVAWVAVTHALSSLSGRLPAAWRGPLEATASRLTFWAIAVGCAALLLE